MVSSQSAGKHSSDSNVSVLLLMLLANQVWLLSEL